MIGLYPYGYGGQMLPLEVIDAKPRIRALNPEFWRRYRHLMMIAAAEGVACGVGGSTRYYAEQVAEALRRHTTIDTGRTSQLWNGVRYYLRHGMAPYLFPGTSAHEQQATAGGAVAIDQVPAGTARAWFTANCHRVGLRHFADVNDEPWHCQPAEWPPSRRLWPSPAVLARIDLPPIDWPPELNPPPTKPENARMITLSITLEQMSEGSQGRDVARLQACVNALTGSDLDLDGDYGPETRARVVDLQRFFGLDDDGIAGPITLSVVFDL